ncbi:MAG: hypothetical protein WA435_09560 [Gallionellaceae bacterium]
MHFLIAERSLLPFLEFRQHDFYPLRREHLVRQCFQYDAIQLLHGDGFGLAQVAALTDLGIALVIAITPTLAGCQRHASPTATALEQTGEQCFCSHNLGRNFRRGARRCAAAYACENFRLDNGFNGKQHPFALRLQFLGLVVMLVEVVLANVGRIRQHLMHSAFAPLLTA